MINVPEVIYLNIGEGGDETDDFKELDVTWCSDRINSNDIEYVRSTSNKHKLCDVLAEISTEEYTDYSLVVPMDHVKKILSKYFA